MRIYLIIVIILIIINIISGSSVCRCNDSQEIKNIQADIDRMNKNLNYVAEELIILKINLYNMYRKRDKPEPQVYEPEYNPTPN